MNKYDFFTSKELKPNGWLLRQLQIQADGLSGHLDKMWPSVRDSAWIGGSDDGWERVPYWLDGFIPLAYLLENEDMINRARYYIDAIISRQEEDGWICPCKPEERKEYDTWALQLISKVLTVYYECSGDERVPDVIYKLMKNYYSLLKSGEITLFAWGHYRWFESFIALNFLSDRYGEEWIKELAIIIDEQGADYREIEKIWHIPAQTWSYEKHIVNLTMILKIEAVTKKLLGDKYASLAKHHFDLLTKYNGTPYASYTGDECLAGLSPIHGTELCAIVEEMYSLELLYSVTGDTYWADLLEKVSFNALPATISDDMWTHQYVQMSNQMAVVKFPDKPIFTTNGCNAHLFGVEPHYGCCCANFNQGWPKFALSAFMRNGTDVISSVAVPSKLNWDGISLELITEYPFKNKLCYKIEKGRAFTLYVRVPSFVEGVTVNGSPSENCDMLAFDIAEGEAKEIVIEYTAAPHFVSRPHNLNIVEYGNLVFSVPIKFSEKRIEFTDEYEHKYPYCDFEFYPESEWRYGYFDKELTVEEHEVGNVPFSKTNPPITIGANVARIDWNYLEGYDTVASTEPKGRAALSAAEKVKLHPYGATLLRMTEIPFTE